LDTKTNIEVIRRRVENLNDYGGDSGTFDDRENNRGVDRLSQKEVTDYLHLKNKREEIKDFENKDEVTKALNSRQIGTQEFKKIHTHFKATGAISFTGASKEEVKKIVIENSIDYFKYVGFDAIQTRLRVEDREKNKDVFCDEMTAISVLVLTRGTVFNKIFKRTSRDGIDIGQFLTNKYGYRKNNNRGVNNMTLSRHSHVFPDFCALVLATDSKIRVLGTIPQGFPRYLCFPGSMALINSEIKDQYMDMYVDWNLSFSKIIRSDQDRETVKRFAELSYKSPIFSNTERKVILSNIVDAIPARSESTDDSS
jgi:hypothetical protein